MCFRVTITTPRARRLWVLKAMSNQEALDYVAKLKAAGFTKDGASWDKEEIKIGPTFVSYKAANSNGVTVEFWKTFDT